jgi:hypothetical protein
MGRWLAAPPSAMAVLLAAMLAMAGCDSASESNRPPTRHFDAGRVIEGARIKHVFALENQSDAPFTVARVSASCACAHTFLENATGPLRPGQRRNLEVEFDTRAERGSQRKTFIVETDAPDPEWKRIEFALTAEVFRRVQSIPDIVQFGAVPRGQAARRPVTLEINDEAWVGVEPKVIDGRHVRVVAQPGGTPRLKKFAFELEAPAANGPLVDRVTFFYKQPGRELELVVPVQADVTGLLRAVPRRILITELDMSLGKRQHLRITSPGGRPFRVVELELPAGVEAVGERSQAAAAEHDLELAIDGAKLPEAGGLIGVVTDLEEDSRLEIPLVLSEHAAKKS